ncbi:MAG: efflux RND transporter periplasmic adaptor subunit [Bacteroidales bacterium]|jgi:HlyD family secretion protein|nr:efflux RND transporter periplasmic adaptor subunit [Bacteroidales bacterium]
MKSNNLLKILVIVVAILVVIAIIGKNQGWFGKELTVKVAVEKAEKRTVIEMITANGKIQPVKEVKISPDVSGEIVLLNVEEGDYVNQGDLLFKIKPDTYISMRDRAMAALESSKARLAQAKAQFIQSELAYKRSKQLYGEETISQSDYEQAEASYKVAQAEVEAAEFSVKSAEASLSEAREALMKTTVYAPMSGTISLLLVEEGERVVGTEMMTGTEILRIADLSRMEAQVEVNENDIIKVKLNDTAIIEVDAYLDHNFRGVVTEIANSATTTGVSADQVTTFDVKIFILPESYSQLMEATGKNPFRPGMSTTVDIQTEIKYDIITVPIQAVTTRTDSSDVYTSLADEEEKTIVFASDGIYALAREVRTGIQDNNFIEIISGLEENTDVISAPYSAISKKLADSTLIEILPREELFDIEK